MPVVPSEQLDRTAERGAEVVVAQRRRSGSRLLREESGRVELVVGNVVVHAAAVRVRAGFAGVLDEAAAGVTVLRRIRRRDDLHFLDGFHGRRALVALLMSDGVAERCAVEEVLGRHRLTAVDPRVELAAAEHRVAVRTHGEIAGLDLQDGLRQPHVRGGHDRQRPVVLFVDRVGDVGGGDVDAAASLDLHGFLEPADLHGDVVADRLAALEQNPARDGFLESLHVHGDRILAEDQRRTRVRAGAVRDDDGVDAGRSLWIVTVAPGNAPPCASVTTPLMTARSARCAKRGVLEQTLKQRLAARTRRPIGRSSS